MQVLWFSYCQRNQLQSHGLSSSDTADAVSGLTVCLGCTQKSSLPLLSYISLAVLKGMRTYKNALRFLQSQRDAKKFLIT